MWVQNCGCLSVDFFGHNILDPTKNIEEPIFTFRGVRIFHFFKYSERKIAELFANSENPDQTLHCRASDLGVHSFSSVPFRDSPVSNLQQRFWGECIGSPIPLLLASSCIYCSDYVWADMVSLFVILYFTS